MLRWPSSADRAAMILVAALSVVGLAPLKAQQATSPAPAAGTATVQASVPSATVSGPRIQPEYRSFQPSLADSSATGRASSMEGRHTIALSTLSLILIVVIIVLLVAR
ncbi:MAG: hypothetical protein ACREMW_03110 [Gemmatimonadales bacterium]